MDKPDCYICMRRYNCHQIDMIMQDCSITCGIFMLDAKLKESIEKIDKLIEMLDKATI